MKLPESQQDWEEVKERFIDLGIEDTAQSWYFIISQLQNTKMPDLEFDYTNVFNHYKRWKISTVLQDVKTVYMQELQDKLEAHMKAEEEQADGSSSDMQREPHDIQSEMPALQEPTEDMVQAP